MMPHRSTGLSNRFSNVPVDWQRYSVAAPGTAQKQRMAPKRVEKTETERTARHLHDYFQAECVPFDTKYLLPRNPPTQTEFKKWFEYLMKKVDPDLSFPEVDRSGKPIKFFDYAEEVSTFLATLGCPYKVTVNDVISFNTPVNWPKFLMVLDWLRQLVSDCVEEQPRDERQEILLKYSIETYRMHKYKGVTDYTEAREAIRELVIGGEDANEFAQLNADLKQEEVELDAKIQDEVRAIEDLNNEIGQYVREAKDLENKSANAQLEINRLTSMETEVNKEIEILKQNYERLQHQFEDLQKQEATQTMTAEEAQDLKRRRIELRDQVKEKDAKIKQLNAKQVEVSKEFSVLATQKTNEYRKLCSMIAPHAVMLNAQTEFRNFESALFGGSAQADAIRVDNLGNETIGTFRALLEKMRSQIQCQHRKMHDQHLDAQLHAEESEVEQIEQEMIQAEERHALEVEQKRAEIVEAEKEVKKLEVDCEQAKQYAAEAAGRCFEADARLLEQQKVLKELDEQQSAAVRDELQLTQEFLDECVTITSKVASANEENQLLLAQKKMLEEALEKGLAKLDRLHEDTKAIAGPIIERHHRLMARRNEPVESIFDYDDPPEDD
ncbi:hypothetical protein M3Y98_00774800 [Aphelenchoides besseyi]|nr:hypothetical protein M3Y98_00774800 [Aphelenchoides besseyi]KAI6211774.1 hypothetical protein M3Y96_00470100 [Aphelenchoides besseyi]